MIELPAAPLCWIPNRPHLPSAAIVRPMMLYEFVNSNRDELIRRCTEKVARRFAPSSVPAVVVHGVPLFLEQLVDALQLDLETPAYAVADPHPTEASSEIHRSAALHGADLLRLGYSAEQVGHDYGDVCQAVTDLAVEQNASIDVDEFRTLNRCLDNAIAAAVTAFGQGRKALGDRHAEDLHHRLTAFVDEQRRLVDIAIHAYTAIRTGSVGSTGATGALLVNALGELRLLADRSVADIRLASATATLAPSLATASGGSAPRRAMCASAQITTVTST